MNTPKPTTSEPPILVEIVGQFLAFEEPAIDNQAELAALKRPQKKTPILVEVVAEFLEFDGPAIHDATALALFHSHQPLAEPVQDRYPTTRSSKDEGPASVSGG